MVPKAEAPQPQQVKLAMKVLTTLGNYSEMAEDDDVVANIHALAGIFLSVGELCFSLLCFVPFTLALYVLYV